jgi:outer membrane protein insertion porin family
MTSSDRNKRAPLLRPSRLISALLALTFAGAAYAFEPFTVKDIRIEGIQRTEAGTVFGYLPVKVGEQFTQEKATQAIRDLYATGFFKDVRIEVDGDVLVVMIEERPAIASVDVTGIKEFDTEGIKKSLKEVGLGEARIFDKSLLDKAEQELKRQYLTRGKYGMQVTTTVTPLERNRVAISVAVDEGEVAKIHKIAIVGNKAVSEKELLEQLQLTTPGWFTWYTKADQYSKQKLAADLETIRSYYLNRGYLEFNVESTQVSITPDKKDIYITVNIKEGPKYSVSDVKLAGEMLGLEDDLKPLVKIKPGDTFNAELINESTKAITDKFGGLGYAFANVNAAPEVDREKNQVALTFFVDPSRRVYVRNINISGNTRTRDEVIRRELRQFESAWYDGERIKLSRERVDRLGYFKDVNIETPPVPGATDQVDVNVAVTERPTGSLNLTAGYSQTDKLVLGASISQNNVFGSGNTLGLDVNTSELSRTIAVSQTNPYFTLDGVSRATTVYYRTERPLTINVGDYTLRRAGAGLTFGIPFTEYDTVFFGASYEGTDLKLTSTSPPRYIQYVNDFGQRAHALIGTVGWAKDDRDSGLAPTKGRYQRANFEASVAGDLRYYRATYQHQYFWPISRTLTLAMNGEINYGRPYGGKPFPIIKNMYAGGIGTVRGFDGGSLGPRDVNGDALGAPSRMIGNIELLLPMPGSQQDRTLRWFGFFDAGNVFEDRPDFGDLRYSAGFGISWISPIGPLKLSLAKPLNQKPGDKVQKFQFQIGTGF